MKVKSWRIIMKAFAVISLTLILSFAGCTKSTVEESEDISIFDAKAPAILSSSLVDMPLGLVIKTPEDSTEACDMNYSEACDMNYSEACDMKRVDFNLTSFRHNSNIDLVNLGLDPISSANIDSTNKAQVKNYGALFDTARNYATVAAEVKSKIQMFIQNLIPGLSKLKGVDLPVELPEYLVGKFGLHKIVIGPSDDERYIWKIGLYYSQTQQPQAVFFLSITDEGGKGRMFMQMEEEEDEYAASAGISGLMITKKIEAIFDGTRNPKKFEVKYVGDRSAARDYAKEHWGELESDAKAALTSVPDKFFLTINYNQETGKHSVYGASYHPGWRSLKDLEGRAFWNDESRTVYMFKAKNLNYGLEGAAKLALSLPRDTTKDSNVWESDSVSEIFAQMVSGQLNDNILKLNDDINDCPPYASGNCVVQQTNPVTGEPVEVYYEPAGTLSLYSGEVPAEKKKATVIYDCIMDDCRLQDTSDAIPSNPNAVIARDGLERFVHTPPKTGLFDKVHQLYEQCGVISYMINPAFFRSDRGLQGTYDTQRNRFYKYNYGGGYFDKGTPNTDPIDNLLDLSLDDIGSYIPSKIKAANIAL